MHSPSSTTRWSVCVALSMAAMLTLPAPAAPANASATNTAAKAEAAKAAAAQRERQAEVRKGIELLERARSFLQYKDDKVLAGHKQKALDYTERALKELRDALELNK